MGVRMEELIDEAGAEEFALAAAWESSPEGRVWQAERRANEAVRRAAELEQERAWAAEYPAEWAAWRKTRSSLLPDFGGEHDFPEFLRVVGRRPSKDHVLRPRVAGGFVLLRELRWEKRKQKRSGAGDSPYLTYREAVERFNVSKSVLYRWRDEKRVDCVKVPGLGWRFVRESVERLMAEHTSRTEKKAKVPPVLSPRKPVRRQPPTAGAGFRFLK